MKYSTILPAFLFLAGSALLPISSYADSCGGEPPQGHTNSNEDPPVPSDGDSSDTVKS